MSVGTNALLPDMPFGAFLTPRRSPDGWWSTEVPEGWLQGRGAFGGIVIGAMIRALEAQVADVSRPLRSITAEICGPVVAGPVQLAVEMLRAGSGVSTAACRLVQSEQIQAHAVGVFGKSRAIDLDGQHLAPPRMRSWRDWDPIPLVPLAPEFARHFEFRTAGPVPFSGARELEVEGWVRPRNPGPARDATYVAVCADAWWSPVHAMSTVPRPLATIAFTLQLCGTVDGLDPDAPLFHRARDVVVRDGYFVELRELWGEDGRLVALNQQTFAIIK
jgi:Thioesterase-like superfamily